MRSYFLKWIFRAQKMQLKTLKPFRTGSETAPLKISFCEKNPEIAQTLAHYMDGLAYVAVYQGDLLYLSGDVLISPANSFGDMGGGLDKAIDDFFKGEAQARIQARLAQDYWGEIPVGQAFLLDMPSSRFPRLLVAPTMRIPGTISQTIQVYLAMRAILMTTLHHNRANPLPIREIICPSLGTGIGAMPYQESAFQMLAAIVNILEEKWRAIAHPVMAPLAQGPEWIRKQKAGIP